MEVVKDYPPNTVVVAEEQTNGRGKGDRTWISKKSDNIYISILIDASNKNVDYFNYSFLTALALLNTIKNMVKTEIDIKMKWPNDLLVNGKKFGGILLEKDTNTLVIGVGVNVDESPTLRDRTIFTSTDLKKEGYDLDKKIIVEKFIKNFENLSDKLLRAGFGSIREDILKCIYNLGKEITVKNGGSETVGIFSDLDSNGVLILKCGDGSLKRIHSGDVF
jgi:BirA family biotin operon repressor/biotin-[acetyl-CoA-carboxylase] ligase